MYIHRYCEILKLLNTSLQVQRNNSFCWYKRSHTILGDQLYHTSIGWSTSDISCPFKQFPIAYKVQHYNNNYTSQ